MKRFLIALFVAVPLLAQAQHRVSRIEINSSVPDRILLTQSTLAAGRSYSDADLEVAVARLRRLPFVYDARYRLDGETLILDVEAMSRFFGELDASGLKFESSETGFASIGGGGRMFLGSGGVAEITAREHVAEGDDGQTLAGQYAHYGIGGTRFYAVAGISQDFVDEEGVDLDPNLRLTVGYPLTLRSTITSTVRTAGFFQRRSIPITPRAAVSSADQEAIDLRYTFDTTDDPFFARNGLVVGGGPSYQHDKSSFEYFVFFAPSGEVQIRTNRSEGDTTAFSVDATKFWPVRQRGTFFGTARAQYENQDFDVETDDPFPFPFSGEVDSTNLSLAVGYGHNLFDWSSPLGTTRHRIELTLGAIRSEFDRGLPFDSSSSFDSKSANLTYVLRRQFATVRLGLSYTVD